MNATAILLAAGLGTRMRSTLPKALHPIAGRPMLRHLLASCETVFDRAVIVAGPGMETLAQAAAPHPVVIQGDRLGTAHAALQAAAHFGDGDVAILFADNPLDNAPTTLQTPARRPPPENAGLALHGHAPGRPRPLWPPGHWKTAHVTPHRGMGRCHRRRNALSPLCNAGALCGQRPHEFAGLAAGRSAPDNSQGRILPH